MVLHLIAWIEIERHRYYCPPCDMISCVIMLISGFKFHFDNQFQEKIESFGKAGQMLRERRYYG